MEDELTVVFVPRRSRIRPYKMAKALKYTHKVKLILVCEESFYDEDLFEGIFDEVHFFTRKSILFKLPKAEKIYRRLNEKIGFGFRKMKRIIEEINPDIVHCFAEPYNHIEYILRKTKFPVIMSDGADFTGISNGIQNLERRTFEVEKYCFEKVSGIVHKGPKYEIDYYINHGFNISCPEITWYDHCDYDLSPTIEPKKNNDEIHIVYTGAISSNPNIKYIYYLEFAKELARQKIHFHIYPNPYQFQFAKAYKALASREKYFHFHSPVPYKKMAKEISKYNWGLWWHEPTGEKRVYHEKRKVGIGNKLFTYLEAGIPTIIGDHNTYGGKIISDMSIGLKINKEDISNLRIKLLNCDYHGLIKNVKEFAQSQSLQNNSARLFDFYSEVLKGKKTENKPIIFSKDG